MNNLLYETQDKDIGIITINRAKVLNALNTATLIELGELLDIISRDPQVKIVVVQGAGDKAFVAGADIAAMQTMDVLQARHFAKLGQSIFDQLENLPQPVIAAIDGFALGGGLELAMACDIRIATAKSKFAQPEVMLGVIPGFAGTQRLHRLVGAGIAKELLYTGEQIGSLEAHRIGLINKVVSDKTALCALTSSLAKTISAQSKLAVSFCKEAVNKGMNMDINSAVAYEADLFALCFATADQKEGLAAFVEKRQPNFAGK